MGGEGVDVMPNFCVHKIPERLVLINAIFFYFAKFCSILSLIVLQLKSQKGKCPVCSPPADAHAYYPDETRQKDKPFSVLFSNFN